MSKTMTVSGSGKVRLEPDLAIISLTVESKSPDYAKAVDNAAADIESLKSRLASAGHAESSLKTVGFNVNPTYETYQKDNLWEKKLTGFSCLHNLRLEFDFTMDALNRTIAALSTGGVCPELHISFSVRDKSAALEELMNDAVRNASMKADILARAAGVRLAGIESISYGSQDHLWVSNTRMTGFKLAACLESDNSDVAVTPEDIVISDSVTVVWNIEQAQ